MQLNHISRGWDYCGHCKGSWVHPLQQLLQHPPLTTLSSYDPIIFKTEIILLGQNGNIARYRGFGQKIWQIENRNNDGKIELFKAKHCSVLKLISMRQNAVYCNKIQCKRRQLNGMQCMLADWNGWAEAGITWWGGRWRGGGQLSAINVLVISKRNVSTNFLKSSCRAITID